MEKMGNKLMKWKEKGKIQSHNLKGVESKALAVLHLSFRIF